MVDLRQAARSPDSSHYWNLLCHPLSLAENPNQLGLVQPPLHQYCPCLDPIRGDSDIVYSPSPLSRYRLGLASLVEFLQPHHHTSHQGLLE